MPEFVPARGLCRDFYTEIISPALGSVPHSAGLVGFGSEVLGYDTQRSTDHDWGPRVDIFVSEVDIAQTRALIDRAVPDSFRGWPTAVGRDGGPLEHHVTAQTWRGWVIWYLGVDATGPLGTVDWLLLPQQRLLGLVAGPVFADHLGELGDTRARLGWYPDDVWWWILASQWRRIAQEEPFLQRAAEVGDELGSRVLTAQLVRDSMHLALLMSRRYAPYNKWLGTAFSRLVHPDQLPAHLMAMMKADDLPEREAALGSALQALARRHTLLPGATQLDPTVRPFLDRPAMVLDADRFADDCLGKVTDPNLRSTPLIGAIDQLADSTDLLMEPPLIQRARALFSDHLPR